MLIRYTLYTVLGPIPVPAESQILVNDDHMDLCLDGLAFYDRSYGANSLGPEQSWHFPVIVHGLEAPRRRKCSGATTFLTRWKASSRSFTILFLPTTIIESGCPRTCRLPDFQRHRY